MVPIKEAYIIYVNSENNFDLYSTKFQKLPIQIPQIVFEMLHLKTNAARDFLRANFCSDN